MPGRLVLAGTPIGDVADASPALLRAVSSADIIAAEDTRRFHSLCRRLDLDVGARVVSYFEGNESGRTSELVAELTSGRTVVLVTDAGMPSVSDPGYKLVVAAIEAGITVTAVAGPSAVLTALAVSGLPVDRFCFEGFLPRKPGPRATRLAELRSEPRTMVFFEAPHRLGDTLAAMAFAFGADRAAVVCRELTKTYEEIKRGPVGELAQWASGEVLGEITVVVAGAEPAEPMSLAEAGAEVRRLVGVGAKRSEAVATVTAATGLKRQDVYGASLA